MRVRVRVRLRVEVRARAKVWVAARRGKASTAVEMATLRIVHERPATS